MGVAAAEREVRSNPLKPPAYSPDTALEMYMVSTSRLGVLMAEGIPRLPIISKH